MKNKQQVIERIMDVLDEAEFRYMVREDGDDILVDIMGGEDEGFRVVNTAHGWVLDDMVVDYDMDYRRGVLLGYYYEDIQVGLEALAVEEFLESEDNLIGKVYKSDMDVLLGIGRKYKDSLERLIQSNNDINYWVQPVGLDKMIPIEVTFRPSVLKWLIETDMEHYVDSVSEDVVKLTNTLALAVDVLNRDNKAKFKPYTDYCTCRNCVKMA